MTGGDAASVREHVLSPEEYLSQIEFLDDDFEFQHKDGFEHVDIKKKTNKKIRQKRKMWISENY